MTRAGTDAIRLDHGRPDRGDAGRSQRPHSRLWLLFLVLTGLFDPIYGIACKIACTFWYPRIPAAADSPRRRKRGLAIILGGIEGPSWYNLNMARGVLRSRYRGAVVRRDWNAGAPLWRSIVNLASPAHQERQVEALCAYIADFRRQYPDTPISIIAQSGGCWITLRLLESLPPEIQIKTAVLIAPSVSPGYDIRRAADRCESLVSFGSFGDFFFLGIGTLLCGTSDRVFTPSAGLVGWHHRHERFIEARWHPAWVKLGHLGNHTTSAATHFMRSIVAPRYIKGANSARSGAAAFA